MLKIIEKKKIWFSASIIIMVIGLAFMLIRGFNFGIDFKGGTTIVLAYEDGFDKEAVDAIVTKYAPDATTNTVTTEDGANQFEIKSANLDSATFKTMFDELKGNYGIQDEVVSQEEQGGSISKELTENSILAVIVSFIAMLIYVAIRFEFKFGLAAILSLFHDVFITLSVYAIFDIPVNAPFIAAILTIIGYSINDTIVIFDRVRENLKIMRRKPVDEVLNTSITQTLSRSINTVLTVLVSILAVFIFVPSIRDFSFPLVIGIATGCFSSICIASPIYSILCKYSEKRKAAAATK